MAQIVILTFVFLLCILFFIRLSRPVTEPDFKLKGVLPQDKLSFLITALAGRSKRPNACGNGLSLKRIKKTVNAAYRVISAKAAAGGDCLDFERWIYDNYYKLNETLLRLKRSKSVFYRIPHVGSVPRLYELTELLVKSCEGYVTDELLEYAVSVYNAETPLDFSEVRAVAPMLRYALMEYVAIFCAKCTVINRFFSRGAEDGRVGRPNSGFLRYNSYVCGYCSVVSGGEKRKFAELCLDNGNELSVRLDAFYRTAAAYNGCVQSAITTLHSLESWCTDEFLLRLSPLYERLSDDPRARFRALTPATKFLYLYHIGRSARRRRRSESAELREALEKAEREDKDPAFTVLPPPKGKAAVAGYILGVLALAAAGMALFAFWTRAYSVLSLCVGLPIFVLLAYLIIGNLLRHCVLSRALPAYTLKNVPTQLCGTLITVPRLIGAEAEIDDAFDALETLVYANFDPFFSYCLLLDFPAGKNPKEPYDELFLSKIASRYASLREKKRICVVVRARNKVKDEDKYQGWEKKRGALLELNDAVLTGNVSHFRRIYGTVPQVPYVITLDSDTRLNACRRLVEIMLHPYNADKTVVTVNMKVGPEYGATGFMRLFCGGRGLNNYSNYLQEVENDLFGCGNYTGKGIYRVAAFQEKLANAFEENRILSHDYIEGAFAGCASSNVYALDGFPQTYAKFLTRELRWLRGDWQLAAYLLPNVRSADGTKRRNPVGAVGKWHIFCNLLFSLVPICSLGLLLASCFFPSAAAPVLTLAFSPYLLRVVFALRSLVFHPESFFGELARQTFYAAMLPTVALLYLYSIVQTLIRLARGKNLLEWQVSAHAGSSVSFLPNAVMAILVTTAGILFELNPAYFVFAAAFVVAVLTNRLLSIPSPGYKPADEESKVRLISLAKDTFAYFRAQLVPEHHFLPCDHFQEQHEKGWATRTSPTNIGMFLLSFVSAYELKLYSREELNSAMEKVISSVEKLEKWRGNLYNWTDVATLKPMPPRYVSSVDSGNFLACLTAAYAYADADLKVRIAKLIGETDLAALFDEKRGLYYTGYHVDSAAYDNSHYDLMGSESALTYLISTAQHKTGKEAWDNLSRGTVRFRGGKTLQSWTGGLFEYLMSGLFFRFEPGTVMAFAASGAVRAHLRYAGKRNYAVWGISECQYNAEDELGGYCYRAFGVPAIAHSNVPDTTVIAPYASVLALSYAPKEVSGNLLRLSEEGARGKFGLYEAVDLAAGTVIRTYMTHHQGMILAAVADYVGDGVLTRNLQSLPEMRAAALLLTESDRPRAHRKPPALRPLRDCDSRAETVSDRLERPAVNLLTNGTLYALFDSRGGGYSVFGGKLVTRFDGRGDGVKLYAACDGRRRDMTHGTFTAGRAATEYADGDESCMTRVSCSVLAALDGLAYRASYTNLTQRTVTVRFSVLAEPALNETEADLAHPVFTKLFLETGLYERGGFAWARRLTGEKNFFAALLVTQAGQVKYESSRADYYGRGASGISFGRVLDPVLAGDFSVSLLPGQKKEFAAYLLCAYDFERLKYMAKLVSSPGFPERSKGSAYALGGFRNPGKEVRAVASALLYGSGGTLTEILPRKGIRYAHPLICLHVSGPESVERLTRRLERLKELYAYGISFNLVVLFREKYNYYLHLTDAVHTAVHDSGIQRALNGESSLHVVNYTDHPEWKEVFESAAVCFEQVSERLPAPPPPPDLPEYPPAPMYPYPLALTLGLGGFTEDGNYAMDLTDCDTPAPWSNVIAGPSLGAIVTESGGGYTFAGNSRERKLTEWRNDPVLDAPSEFVALGEGGRVWSVTKKPAKTKSSYFVLHALGYSEFRNDYNGIEATERIFLTKNGETKYYDLRLKNATDDARVLDVLFAADLVLGDFTYRTKSALKLSKTDAYTLRAENPLKNLTAFLHGSEPIASYCFRRGDFTADDGTVFAAGGLSGRGSGPCAALSCRVALAAHGETRLLFTLGTEEKNEARADTADERLHTATAYYGNLSPVTTDGDDTLRYLTKWLPYQVLCSRFYGRAGYYQAGGAIGFRDQLQDCLTLLYVDPGLVREHILDCACHQFEAGDVQHWWHEPAVGVRTRICDDRLFLPYVVAEYVRFTHDYTLMAERVPFLSDVTMTPEDVSVYAAPGFTEHRASILEHCIRALEVSCDFGENGLVRMRGGDWNDAMDKVGEKGFGTSVWASMFLYHVLEKFLPFINDRFLRTKYDAVCLRLSGAVERAWAGDRYVRAYTDDGTVLGSEDSKILKIDLLTQSWATLAKIGDPEKRKIALGTAADKLVDRKAGIIRLLTPPVTDSAGVGYLGDYPAGVRENGGQYTHAAVWYAAALFQSGKTDEGYEALTMLSPVSHTRTAEGVKRYCIEPYVLAGDVYGGERTGRGGWSWYTGSASWMYKCIVSELLGIRFDGKIIRFSPQLPKRIDKINVKIKTEFGPIELEMINGAADAPWRLKIGEVTYNTDSVTVTPGLVGKRMFLVKG